ncbi:MAG: hypothetical protein J7518_19195 [Nocardioidaceae bacterium]|nr:hypothetical protein [Nocardioidaceae bacterium]
MRVRLLVLALVAAVVGVAAPAHADAATVTLNADRKVSVAGTSVRFWGSTSNTGNGTLKIRIEPAGAAATTFAMQEPAEGPYQLTLALTVNTRVTAVVEGGTTDPASDTVFVWVRPRIATTLHTGYARSGAYLVMKRGASPLFRTLTYPKRPGQMCLRHQLQRYRDGAWRARLTSACIIEDSTGRVSWRWAGSHPSGVRFRVRALFAGDSRNLAGNGAWLYFRFK